MFLQKFNCDVLENMAASGEKQAVEIVEYLIMSGTEPFQVVVWRQTLQGT